MRRLTSTRTGGRWPRPPRGRAHGRTTVADKLVQTETRRVGTSAAALGMNNMSGRKSRSRRRRITSRGRAGDVRVNCVKFSCKQT